MQYIHFYTRHDSVRNSKNIWHVILNNRIVYRVKAEADSAVHTLLYGKTFGHW
jgi:hypothetical protein